MADSFVSFSNQNSMDFFPSFRNFHESNNDQGAFTIDRKDLEEMQNNIPATSVQKEKKPKKTNMSLTSNNKTSSNPLAQCDICSVPISSQIVYDSHIKGKKHQTQLTALLAKNPEYKAMTYDELCSTKQVPITVNNESENPVVSLPEVIIVQETNTTPALIPSKKLNCNLCNISCNSQQMFDNHTAGKKHQMKVKLNSFTSPAPPRLAPDNNPSSSNYCDVCSIQFNSEDGLTEHLAQKRHQTREKEVEFCTKEAADMNIHFDDYKISISNPEKNIFDYQCTKCNKKFQTKVQLITHLKSNLHTRLSNQSNNQRLLNKPRRGDHQTTRGGVMRGGTTNRGQSFSSFRGSSRPPGKSRPYRSRGSTWNQSRPSFDQSSSQSQPTSNIDFGAFEQNSQSTISSNNNFYSQTKRSTQYEEYPNEFDEYYPKRIRTYNDEDDHSQNYYPTEGTYYQPSTFSNYPSNSSSYSAPSTNYNDQSSSVQLPWENPTEPLYDQQQYLNTGSSYTNQMNYPPNQPPLPDYEPPPPLPSYPPPPSQNHYAPSSTYLGGTENQGNNNFYQNSFHY